MNEGEGRPTYRERHAARRVMVRELVLDVLSEDPATWLSLAQIYGRLRTRASVPVGVQMALATLRGLERGAQVECRMLVRSPATRERYWWRLRQADELETGRTES